MPEPEPELECPILILIELHVDINRRHGCQFACANPIRQRESIAKSTDLWTKYYWVVPLKGSKMCLLHRELNNHQREIKNLRLGGAINNSEINK